MKGSIPQALARTFSFSRPDDSFRAALFLSVLLHALVLAFLHPPLKLFDLKPGGGEIILTVELGARPSAAAATAAPQLKPEEGKKESAVAVPPPEPRPKPAPAPSKPVEARVTVESENRNEPVTVSETTEPVAEDKPATLVDNRPPVIAPGMATVFLQISEEGKALQIIWDKVPHVTPEQLLEMERMLRTRTYPATGSLYTLADTIRVPRKAE